MWLIPFLPDGITIIPILTRGFRQPKFAKTGETIVFHLLIFAICALAVFLH